MICLAWAAKHALDIKSPFAVIWIVNYLLYVSIGIELLMDAIEGRERYRYK